VKRLLLAALCGAGSAGAADHPDAHQTAFPAQRMLPMADDAYGFGPADARGLDHAIWRVGGWGMLYDGSLVEAGVEPERSIIGRRVDVGLSLAAGLLGRGQLALTLPFTVSQKAQYPGRHLGPVASSGLGDVRLRGLYRLPESLILKPAVGITLDLPSGDSGAYMGRGEVAGGLAVMGHHQAGRVDLRASVGYRVEPRRPLFGERVDDHLELRILAALGRGGEPFAFTFSSVLTVGGLSGFSAEVLAGFVLLEQPVSGFVAGGLPASNGVQVPRHRLLLGVQWQRPVPPPPPPPDRDGDQVEDARDQCPDEAEDVDGDRDHDGCPDLDRDNDGILDADDRCPDRPEDVDQFEDVDGCPDLDNDRDDVPDRSDQCPLVPENINGIADADGCPEPDADADGLLDPDDQCPEVPEDIDRWQDTDGCPEPDNDADGLLDLDDDCPDEAETVNGIDDEDGCPDEVLAAVQKKRQRITSIRARVFFNKNRATFRSRTFATLDAVAQLLLEHPEILRLRVEGHSDGTGRLWANRRLSQKRAEAVRHYLLTRGVDAARLEAKGYGWSRPRDRRSTRRARRRNRRVEFNVLSLEKSSD
jgi:outer membrane protein OmpA-like peptidoglycan-associated protein